MKLICILLLLSQFAFSQNNVGFISLTRFDNTRQAVEEQREKERGRIIQINFWYPVHEPARNRVTFLDYVALAGLELDSSRNNGWRQKGIEKYFEWPESLKADRHLFLQFLDRKIPMKAAFHQKLPAKQYPLVMLVHGFAADHAYLAENLAASGYAVMQIPVKGTTKYELDYEGKGLESQVLDYEFGLHILQTEMPVITKDIAAVGFSFGAQSAAALAVRNSDIRSLISLDGGIGSAFGAQLLQSYCDVTKIKIPILHLYNPNDAHADLSWLSGLRRNKVFLVSMKNMEHGHFTSFGILNESVPGIMGIDKPDPETGYKAVILVTTEFLNRSLKDQGTLPADTIARIIDEHPWLTESITKHDVIS